MPDKSQSGTTAPTYLINRSKESDAYSVWKFELDGSAPLSEVPVAEGATFPRHNHLAAIGGYMISYSPPKLNDDPANPTIDYRVFGFDPKSSDPLNGQAVQEGLWLQSKFWGFFDHFTWDASKADDIVRLVPMTGYVLGYMPTAARATFQLWNFDPAPSAPGSTDPLPTPAMGAQSAFSLIGQDSQLLPVGNYVLEFVPQDARYRVWSFDPQAATPLAIPAITEGTWADIEKGAELLVVGEHILEWTPGTGEYRLWGFDPHAANPFSGPIHSGKLPQGFDASSVLTSIQNIVPADPVRAETPGTMDFMRDKIEHIVVYMLESRTMDNVLGWLYENSPAKINYVDAEPPFRGTSFNYSNEADGKTFPVYQFKGGKLSEDYDLNAPVIDPFHDTSDCIKQQFGDGYGSYLNGADADMSRFVKNNLSPEVMGTLTPTQLPVLNGLAASYAVCDAWFSAVPGTTTSNRASALTGSNFNVITNLEGNPQYEYFTDQARRQSIWKVLWNNGIKDWKIYWSVKWMGEVFTYQLLLKGDIPSVDKNVDDYVAPLDQFMADATAGTLPQFSFLEPAWIAPTGSTSYHPGGDLVPPERELNKIFRAVADGPGWNKTAFVITFSKGGGLYDHVPTPRTINPWPKDVDDGFSYDVLGPRVPTIVVSPWVNENTVFRSPGATPLSHSSLLATLLQWYGIPTARWGLGDRVQAAESFERVFQRSTPRTDKPTYPEPYDKSYPPETKK